jgi:hypothetical protein
MLFYELRRLHATFQTALFGLSRQRIGLDFLLQSTAFSTIRILSLYAGMVFFPSA